MILRDLQVFLQAIAALGVKLKSSNSLAHPFQVIFINPIFSIPPPAALHLLKVGLIRLLDTAAVVAGNVCGHLRVRAGHCCPGDRSSPQRLR